MYIHVGAESAQIYTGMGARACMVKSLDARKTWHHFMLSVYCIRCISIYVQPYMYMYTVVYIPVGVAKNDCILQPCPSWRMVFHKVA